MRKKIILGILGLVLTCTALVSTPRPAEAQVICPRCVEGYHCCIYGNTAKCVKESTPC
jgi:hypothetical protein